MPFLRYSNFFMNTRNITPLQITISEPIYIFFVYYLETL
jgi:hypothetical protein